MKSPCAPAVPLGSLLLLLGILATLACRSSEPSVASLATEGTESLAALVEEVVADEARAGEAQRILASYLKEEEAYFEDLKEQRKALFTLQALPSARREGFDELNLELNSARREFLARTVEMLGDLKRHLRASEWESVFSGMKAMDEKWEALEG